MPSGACGGRAPTAPSEGLPGACRGRCRAPPHLPTRVLFHFPRPAGAPRKPPSSPPPEPSPSHLCCQDLTFFPRSLIHGVPSCPDTTLAPHTDRLQATLPSSPRRGERGLLSAHPHTGSGERTSTTTGAALDAEESHLPCREGNFLRLLAAGTAGLKVRPWPCTQEGDPLSRVSIRPVVSTGSLDTE